MSNILSYQGNSSQNYPEILTLAGMVLTKKTRNKCWWGWGYEEALISCWWECGPAQLLSKAVGGFLKKKTEQSYVSDMPLPEGFTSESQRCLYISALQFYAQQLTYRFCIEVRTEGKCSVPTPWSL